MLIGCSHLVSDNKKQIFLNNSTEITEKIKDNLSDLDYREKISIILKDTELVYNKSNEAKTGDDITNIIVYYVVLENISQEDIKTNLKLYIPDELNSIILADSTFGPKEKDIQLKPGEKINISFGTLMKHYEQLSEKEKEVFDEYRDTLYLELKLNNKTCYSKLINER